MFGHTANLLKVENLHQNGSSLGLRYLLGADLEVLELTLCVLGQVFSENLPRRWVLVFRRQGGLDSRWRHLKGAGIP